MAKDPITSEWRKFTEVVGFGYYLLNKRISHGLCPDCYQKEMKNYGFEDL